MNANADGKKGSLMKMGDCVEVIRGRHMGKEGTIVSTRGSHTSNCVLVRLNRVIRGRIFVDPHHSADQAGVPVSDLKVVSG